MRIFYLLFSILSITLFSCASSDDEDLFKSQTGILQNEGYFPLAPNNSWSYENWITIKNNDGTFEYTGSPLKNEHTIESVSTIVKNSDFRVDYGFTPYKLGEIAGGFFGNFNQITKINEEYIKKSIIKVEKSNPNGTSSTHLEYKLDDQIFLTDNPQIGQIISSKSGSYGDVSDGFYFEYKVNSYVVGFLEKLPNILTARIGVDDHLRQYSNILHTSDTIKIIKLIFTSSGGTNIDIKGVLTIPANSSSINSKLDISANAFGVINTVTFVPTAYYRFLVLYGIDGLNLLEPGPYIRLYDANSFLTLCESKANIDNKIKINSAKYELISNQPLFYTDNYWVKGVGNIKSITSPSTLRAKINFLEGNVDPIKLKLESTDPNCINNTNTLEMKLNAEINFNETQVQFPISLGSTWIIQNLRNFTQRKTLN